jgi:hypothetical protein
MAIGHAPHKEYDEPVRYNENRVQPAVSAAQLLGIQRTLPIRASARWSRRHSMRFAFCPATWVRPLGSRPTRMPRCYGKTAARSLRVNACGNNIHSVMGDNYPKPGNPLGPAIVVGYAACSAMLRRVMSRTGWLDPNGRARRRRSLIHPGWIRLWHLPLPQRAKRHQAVMDCPSVRIATNFEKNSFASILAVESIKRLPSCASFPPICESTS